MDIPEQVKKDVLTEYQWVCEQFSLTPEVFWSAIVPLVQNSERDPDRLADALKEFIVRTWDNGVHDSSRLLIEDLRYARTQLGQQKPDTKLTMAANLFGTAAEDLGAERIEQLARNILAAVDVVREAAGGDHQ